MIESLREIRPDVVALQECAWRLRHQSSQIGGPLDMQAARAGTLGLLSRFPAQTNSRRMPSHAKGGSKRVLVADVSGIRIVVVHFPLDEDVRESHARQFVTWAHDHTGPMVVCGDFNERRDGPAVTLLLENGFADAWTRGGGDTWPASHPKARIDFILLHGDVRVQRTELIRPAVPASDHLGVLAELATPASARS